jgi:FixJ family two-component response regulator
VKNKAFECGASAFLEKPFSMQQLVNSIKETLKTPEDKDV